MYLRILGLPLGLPLEFILLDWSGTNYSSARAIFEQAYQRFVIWQTMLADEFLTPVIEWKIDEWYSQGLLKGRLPADLTIYWNRPTYPWIDQLKEVQAKGSMVDRGFATHAEVCKSRRLDRAELVAAHKAEIINAIQTAQEIAADPTIADYVAKHSITIPWEQFAGHKAGGEVGRPAGEYPAAGTTPEPDDGQTGQDTE
jgi:capsid protein